MKSVEFIQENRRIIITKISKLMHKVTSKISCNKQISFKNVAAACNTS